jgi:hypothetical protein
MAAVPFPPEMEKYPDEWIALSRDGTKMMGHGKTPQEAIDSAGGSKTEISLFYNSGRRGGVSIPSVTLSDPLIESSVKHSPTVKLAIDIEMITSSAWSTDQRYEVAELIRKYRFEQVSAVLARVHALVKESGNAALTEKIYMGRF